MNLPVRGNVNGLFNSYHGISIGQNEVKGKVKRLTNKHLWATKCNDGLVRYVHRNRLFRRDLCPVKFGFYRIPPITSMLRIIQGGRGVDVRSDNRKLIIAYLLFSGINDKYTDIKQLYFSPSILRICGKCNDKPSGI
jgi:hypothetical protein